MLCLGTHTCDASTKDKRGSLQTIKKWEAVG